jgi:very-short-patch-repair endonuclease
MPYEPRRNNVHAARYLRKRETRAEDILWMRLRDRKLMGLKFRRQHPVGPFVLDFCCPTLRLAVELDGSVHDGQADIDQQRTDLLTESGYTVVRFRNSEVESDMETVLATILTHATLLSEAHPSSTLPSPAHRERGRG